MCIGAAAQAAYAPAIALQRRYAERWGMQHHVIDTARFHARPNLWRKRRVGLHFEKFQVLSLLETYERIVYLDADVVPTVHAPDILQQVPEGTWGCVAEPEGPNDHKFEEELARLQRRLGKVQALARHRYFNAGVLVFDRAHADVWSWRAEEVVAGRWPEQSLLNYRIARDGVVVSYLDVAFNLTPLSVGQWADVGRRHGAAFIHYAGPQAKADMAMDLLRLADEWEALGNG